MYVSYWSLNFSTDMQLDDQKSHKYICNLHISKMWLHMVPQV